VDLHGLARGDEAEEGLGHCVFVVGLVVVVAMVCGGWCV